MASADSQAAAAAVSEDSRLRDTYNELRSGDHGVSFEAFLRALYFLQDRQFTLWDAKEAFQSSTTSNERFLSYRDLQFALIRVARARYLDEQTSMAGVTEAQLLLQLLEDMARNRAEEGGRGRTRCFDSVRRQLVKQSVLEVLEQHLRKLIQCFQVYGREDARVQYATHEPAAKRKVSAMDTSSTISLDGFIDFLNAYMEYEDYFPFKTLEQMARDAVDTFPGEGMEPGAVTLHFPLFIELFCRVASAFHVCVLEREGAQLRRAVESCRLEFSIELLMNHMNIRLHHDDTKDNERRRSLPTQLSGYEQGMEGLTIELEADESFKTLDSALRAIRRALTAGDDTAAILKAPKRRAQSLLMARLPPRKTVVTSPPGESRVVSIPSWRGGEEETEVSVFFDLMLASVYDSGRKDLLALNMYRHALQRSEQLPLQHPGRGLVRSTMGCMLFYMGEVELATRCHEQALEFRRHAPGIGEEHIDTATAMNNLACCLSQTAAALEDAYLLLKAAKLVYVRTFGSSHPRAEVVNRNLDRVLACQRVTVPDPVGALARGEYSHVIPGSRFQIRALVPIPKPAATGKKKKKKGAKDGKKKKK
ncbi:hypothetical protein P43SY_006276 [Pythium insidiosum]|uniref:Uncharacterized protein n=1 Tax=Pythium insidiosum TaxID=114742 RepID=A0AAD5M7E9_PYTIN|nr:hypothetical protein P43SY_006276 [Pythium insidiosum]